MSQKPFYNIHAHVFNMDCVPDTFLRVIPKKIIRKYPVFFKKALNRKGMRSFIAFMAKLTSFRSGNKRSEIDKYISFLNVAGQISQQEVFELALEAGKKFDPSVRIVGLTMNMDYMDNAPSSGNYMGFSAQLEQVKQIKRYYPEQFYPFLGIDPRYKSGKELARWAEAVFGRGFEYQGKMLPYFSGIKLYPALGYFPFDPRLTELYAFAEKYDLPVITHCTRVGSQYVGSDITKLIPKNPPMMFPNGADPELEAVRQRIYKRIDAYYENGMIADSKIGENDYACDLFSHPDNYLPVLKLFPKLKLCLAHVGGSYEIIDPPKADPDLDKIRKVDTTGKWSELIIEMMKVNFNLYTDISYTLSDLDIPEYVKKMVRFLETEDDRGEKLAKRFLFGTDFFMTEREKREEDLYQLAGANLSAYIDQIGRDNPEVFLRQ